MNRALWKKTFGESRWLLAGSMALMFAIQWLRVWIGTFFSLSDLQKMLSFLPQQVEDLLPVPISQIATPAGRIAVGYDDPVVLMLLTVWAIARGSDAISGELNRGTMEMLLAQPVTRLGVLSTQAAVTLLGAALLAGAALCGTTVGLTTLTLEQPVSPRVFVPAAMNLFALTVFLAGLSTMVSSASNTRSRTIGIVGAFYAISMIMKIVGRVAPPWHWLMNVSFFTPFEPQMLVGDPRRAWAFRVPLDGNSFELGGLGYDSILIGLGLACYVAAAIVFCQRDLPAPL